MIKTIALALTLAIAGLGAQPKDACSRYLSDSYSTINHICKGLIKAAHVPLDLAFAGQSEKREPRVTVHSVANATELTAALAKAVGGDVIRLASGNYGAVRIANFKPQGLVTIVTADAGAPAHFDTLNVNGSQNLAFRGLDIGRPLAAGEADWIRMADIRDSSRIVFDRVAVHGSLDGDYQNDGYGIFASNVDGLVITGSSFIELTKGLVVQQIQNLQIDNNSFRHMRSDAVNVAASRNVLVDKNSFQYFHPLADDHPDAIQFYNVAQPHGSSDIVIRNNVLLPGGSGPQGVWMSDPGTEGYRNVTIENNLLWSSGQYNGIGIVGATGVKIIGNTVVSPTNDDKSFWIRLADSADIQMSGNITDNVIVQANVTNLRDTNNTVFARDPGARNAIPNLDAPVVPEDLIVPGKGYHPVVAPTKAPVSDAMAGSIGSLLGNALGASLGKSAILADSDTASHDTIRLGAFASTTSMIEEAAPVSVVEPVAVPVFAHYSVEPFLGLNHFTAMA